MQIERIVPASGNLSLLRQQFWLGTPRAGQTVRLWIGCDWVHLSIGDQRIKTVPSRYTVTDLDTLTGQGGVPAGPAPGSTRERDGSGIVEVTRIVNRAGSVQLGTHNVIAAYVLAGRRVGVWIEDGGPLLFFDPDTRELLRSRENPLTPTQARRLQRQSTPGVRPRPSLEPVTVQRRAWSTGCILIAGQKIALGRQHAGQMVTVHVSETTLAVELPDVTPGCCPAPPASPCVTSKASGHGPPQFSSPCVAPQLAQKCRASPDGLHELRHELRQHATLLPDFGSWLDVCSWPLFDPLGIRHGHSPVVVL